MKLHIALLTLVCLTLAGVPALSQGYDNGPVNGQVDALTINFGFAVSDTFHVNSGTALGSISFWAWLEPGDTATSAVVAIGHAGYFSDDISESTVSLTQSNCFTNNFGFDVCHESGQVLPTDLNPGNYYVTLENAVTAEGNPLYWDENSGVGCMSQGCPSSAQENTLGTVPSEAFTLNYMDIGTTSGTGTTPEPGSIMLFGAGLLAIARRLRGKLF